MVEALQKGENISLEQFNPFLNKVDVNITWLKKAENNNELEIDASAFMLTLENKVRTDADFIFYNQPQSENNAVILNNKRFVVRLDSIPEKIHKISFVLTIHEAKQKQQNFSLLEKITIQLSNSENKQKLVSYSLEDADFETAIILGQLYRYREEWKFKAIGQGYVNGLDVLAKHFGVDIDEEPFEAQPQNATEKTFTENLPKPPSKMNTQKIKEVSHTVADNAQNEIFDIHNTDVMTTHEYYVPILKWLKQKHISADINQEAVDTTGFFDEVAVALGDNYEPLKIINHIIKRRQQNGRDKAYIELSRYSPEDRGLIKNFCQQLYEHSFVAKYFYNKHEKKVILHLQTANKIVQFFNGEWLEWYAFMKIVSFCHQQQINFSCARNMKIALSDEDKYELDVFFLINDMPLFIECKSGEYRGFIDKYSKLRKKLNIDKPYFLFLILGHDEAHIKGLNAMFDITFMNEKTFVDYIPQILNR